MDKSPATASVELGSALVKALSLPENVTKLVLTMEGGKAPVVECTYFAPKNVDEGDVTKFTQMEGRYKLVPIND